MRLQADMMSGAVSKRVPSRSNNTALKRITCSLKRKRVLVKNEDALDLIPDGIITSPEF